MKLKIHRMVLYNYLKLLRDDAFFTEEGKLFYIIQPL